MVFYVLRNLARIGGYDFSEEESESMFLCCLQFF